MLQAPSESGRTRLVVTIVLAVLIGAAGAILLPGLIHEAKPPEATTFRAEIGFDVPPDGLPETGVFRVFAARHDLHLSVELPIPAGTDPAAVLEFLAAPVRAAGWLQEAQPTVAGEALSFPSVTAVGGAAGAPGVTIWISAGSRPGQALALRIRERSCAQGAGGRVRAAWSARAVVDPDDAAEPAVPADTTTDWVACTEVLRALARALQDAGWLTETEEGGALVVRALPDGAKIGSAMLTVAYRDAVPPSHDWSIELVP